MCLPERPDTFPCKLGQHMAHYAFLVNFFHTSELRTQGQIMHESLEDSKEVIRRFSPLTGHPRLFRRERGLVLLLHHLLHLVPDPNRGVGHPAVHLGPGIR